MNWPMYDNGALGGLLLGLLFGYVLEGGGLGSPRKLLAQFSFRDWTVFKVMFSAVIVCAVGLWAFEWLGLIGSRSVYIPTLFIWATALGGLLIGAGFAIGGYCPGTSAVGLASGRGDAVSFILGMMAGTAIFALGFDPLTPIYTAGQGPGGQTLPQLLGLSELLTIIGLVLIGVAGWGLGSWMERRLGGPLTAEEILKPENRQPGAKAEIHSDGPDARVADPHHRPANAP